MTSGRAGQQRPGQRCLLHPVGRQAAARPQRLRPRAGRLDARLLPAQVRRRRRRAAAARHRLGHRAGCRRQLGRAVRALRQAAFRRPDGAGHRDRRARLPGAAGGAAEVGRGHADAAVAARLRARPSCPGAARRRSASCSAFRPRRARCRPSPRPRATPSTAARSPQAIEKFSRGQRRQPQGAATSPPASREWVDADRAGLPRLHAARDPAQRPGHRGADRAGHPARTSTWPRMPVDSVALAAPADRGDEARLRRHLPLCGRAIVDGGDRRCKCSTTPTSPRVPNSST